MLSDGGGAPDRGGVGVLLGQVSKLGDPALDLSPRSPQVDQVPRRLDPARLPRHPLAVRLARSLEPAGFLKELSQGDPGVGGFGL